MRAQRQYSESLRQQGLWSRTGMHSLIHHSDRGCQCLSIRYTERLAEADVESWVGSVGDSRAMHVYASWAQDLGTQRSHINLAAGVAMLGSKHQIDAYF